jgi:hypothetical protein
LRAPIDAADASAWWRAREGAVQKPLSFQSHYDYGRDDVRSHLILVVGDGLHRIDAIELRRAALVALFTMMSFAPIAWLRLRDRSKDGGATMS